jgi:hypothetical protein
VIDGSRWISAMVSESGRPTMPWMTSRCFAGSIVGMPEWCRS